MATEMDCSRRIFNLDLPVAGPAGRLLSLVKRPLEKLVGLEELNRFYARVRGSGGGGTRLQFLQSVLENLNTRAAVVPDDMANIPSTGPLVVVANHPFGAIEGILLASLLESIRPDVKVMANYLLERVTEIRDLFIFVDPFGGPDAARSNVRGLREALDWLGDGGVLAVFPAGTVSYLDVRRREIADPQWSDTVARIVRRSGAAVLPVFFEGANSALFQLAGMVHPKLRTAMLPREFLNKRRNTMHIHIGRTIPFNKLKTFDDDRELTEHLRRRTYLLRYRDQANKIPRPPATPMAAYEPIVPAVDPNLLRGEVDALPAESLLIDNNDHRVFISTADRIPSIMQEIGRLREITFRLTGEGTGRSTDLDEFDQTYLHLFVWNRKTSEIISAYRLGMTDRILADEGPRGLYTSTLFNYKPALLRKLNPAIEMGRSFVRPEYQKGFSPLMLLWKGIGQVLMRNPRYRVLFGPVSISNNYNTKSRQLMVTFLQMHNLLPDLAKLLKAKNPWNSKKPMSLTGGDLDEVSELVSEIEADQKGIPILIKQYLKLGGQMLGFNVDPLFSDVVDGLVYIDLLNTDRRVLEKYMGKQGMAQYLRYHTDRALADKSTDARNSGLVGAGA